MSGPKTFDHLRQIELTSLQHQVMLGCMLGDGGVYKREKNATWSSFIGHSIEQKEYFLWKFEVFRPFFNCYRTYTRKSGSVELCSDSICHPEFSKYGRLWYIDVFDGKKRRKKIVPYKLDITPLTLAVWIMDDGKRSGGSTRIELCSCDFSIEENNRLRYILDETYGLQSKIRYDRKYPLISFTSSSSVQLSNIVRPHIIKSMEYKIF